MRAIKPQCFAIWQYPFAAVGDSKELALPCHLAYYSLHTRPPRALTGDEVQSKPSDPSPAFMTVLYILCALIAVIA